MRQCHRQLRRGVRELSRHHPEGALKRFEAALNSCPVEESDDLERIFYYLGFTLLRLGRQNGAVRSYRAAARLRKHPGHAAQMLRRLVNDYGMVRQPTGELDDWRAFYSIHLERYLRSKATHRVTSDAEADMIRDLIHDYWKRITKDGLLAGRGAEEKLRLFRSVKIVFPFYVVHADLPDDNIIPVDFLTKSRIGGTDKCWCGSGIPFMMCCGRTHGTDELTRGTF